MASVDPPSTAAGIRRIVVPVDLSHESWRVLPLARALGRKVQAPVSPVFVDVSTIGSHAVLEHSVTLVASVDERPIVIEVLPGADVAGTIRQFVSDRSGAAVVMSTHGLGGFSARSWGSVSDDLLRATKHAAIVVGPRYEAACEQGIRRVVVCVDRFERDDPIADDAKTWAQALGVPLTTVTLSSSGVVTEVAGTARAREINAFRDCPDVASAILRYAEAVPGTLLAVSAGRPEQRRSAVTGRVVMAVARDARLPLLLRWYRPSRLDLPEQRPSVGDPVGLPDAGRLSVATSCHDRYEEAPTSAVPSVAVAGTGCHDDYGPARPARPMRRRDQPS